MGFAAVNTYLFAYLKELNIGTTLAGLALTVSTISEIPIMFFANRILARLGSRRMLTLAVAATGVRLLLYAVFTTPAAILVLQLVNGFTFPMFWIAGVAYASERAPKGMQASAQGLFGAATTGIGAALGGLLGGILIASVGGRVDVRHLRRHRPGRASRPDCPGTRNVNRTQMTQIGGLHGSIEEIRRSTRSASSASHSVLQPLDHRGRELRRLHLVARRPSGGRSRR